MQRLSIMCRCIGGSLGVLHLPELDGRGKWTGQEAGSAGLQKGDLLSSVSGNRLCHRGYLAADVSEAKGGLVEVG